MQAYFPAINQSEGVPIKIQDVKGKEWTFQFRFWPNNNSRMYVLEGVTPCIQNMQLQAGDTGMFVNSYNLWIEKCLMHCLRPWHSKPLVSSFEAPFIFSD